ncbi:RNA-directed DNA polymerase, eukaryota, reverse transcriptase zinc-binding domain protein [Tanacetum coccineum]
MHVCLKWSDANIDTIVHVLECFYRASGLRINMSKRKLMGISVDDDKVDQAALKFGCATLMTLFSYLGSKVGGLMSCIQSWNEIVDHMVARLSKWKMKTLSIGGRLTLLKSVLGSMLIYHMSIFKVHMKVLQHMKSIRCHFLMELIFLIKKPIWVKWKNVLAYKEKGGLGVSSLYALNIALMFKWVWWFLTQSLTLWARVITAIHGDDEKIGKNAKSVYPSIWLDIVHELELIKKQGIDVANCIHKKLGNGANTVDFASKLSHISLDYSFRRVPRGGVEHTPFVAMLAKVAGVSLVNMRDMWVWSLEGLGEFSAASVRKLIDDKMLPEVSSKTRWSKAMPIKINVHAWKVRLDCLPTRINISRRGMDIESILCSICDNAVESTKHIIFTCRRAREIFRKISCWWDVSYTEVSSYEESLDWISILRFFDKYKQLLEGVCYTMWWHI